MHQATKVYYRAKHNLVVENEQNVVIGLRFIYICIIRTDIRKKAKGK